jgi:exodeoxyribonuclease V alpha subunit
VIAKWNGSGGPSPPATGSCRSRTTTTRRSTTGTGYIDDVGLNAGEFAASFDGRSITYGFGALDMLVPAYATTIHKSQDSEYHAVIIPVLAQHHAMLQRNLLYTGITRGKRLVVL